jgi:AcrR family transcriptional regulator
VVAPDRTVAIEPKQARAHVTRQRLLDAAVEELLERGYGGVTTLGVARRAGVSRGAQQNYFPHKATLIVAAVRHLAARQIKEVHARLEGVPRGVRRVQAGLDLLYEHYSGPLFAAVVELSLSARSDRELRDVIAGEERAISRTVHHIGEVVLGEALPPASPTARRWATAVSATRGLALLKLLGHPQAGVDRQWSATRRQLLELLTATEAGPPA